MIRVGVAAILAMASSAAVAAPPETVEIYAAGSLRGVVGELAKEATANYQVEVKSTYNETYF